MATVPSISAVAVGEDVSASWANALKTLLDFHENPPTCRVYDGAGVTMTNSVFTLVPFSAEATDTDSMHSTSTNPSRININTSGTYRVDVYTLLTTAQTYTTYSINMRKNAAGSNAGGSSIFTVQNGSPGGGPYACRYSFEFAAVAGDYYEFFIAQTSGANRATVPGDYVTGCTWTWLRP